MKVQYAPLITSASGSWAQWYGDAGEKSGQYAWPIATLPAGYIIDAIAQNGQAETATINLSIEPSTTNRVFEIFRYNEDEGQQTSGWRSYRQVLFSNQTSFTVTVGDGEGRYWIVLHHEGTAPNITFGRPSFKDIAG